MQAAGQQMDLEQDLVELPLMEIMITAFTQ